MPSSTIEIWDAQDRHGVLLVAGWAAAGFYVEAKRGRRVVARSGFWPTLPRAYDACLDALPGGRPTGGPKRSTKGIVR